MFVVRNMERFRTLSRYGYCLNDRKPPRLDPDAEYRIVALSVYYDRPIIERCDGKEFNGETLWIVDRFTLIPCHLETL